MLAITFTLIVLACAAAAVGGWALRGLQMSDRLADAEACYTDAERGTPLWAGTVNGLRLARAICGDTRTGKLARTDHCPGRWLGGAPDRVFRPLAPAEGAD